MAHVSPHLHDAFGRPMTDLRISVTDRCNFRCTFCMPDEQSYHFVPRAQILRFEEVTRVARIFLALGVEKIRLTGGEPLLRTAVEELVAALADLDGLRDLALTTNGYLLAAKAAALRRAGLGRITVSLHSLDPETFARLNGPLIPPRSPLMTRGDAPAHPKGRGSALQAVLDGIEAALRADLEPVKLNAVVVKDLNDHEIVDLVRFARDHGCVMRFIEYMDVGTLNAWDPTRVVSAREIVERIDRVFPLAPVARISPGEVAARYRFRDAAGEVGIIAAVTQPFCGACSRVRLSAEGQLFTCLFGVTGRDLREPLRSGASDEELRELIRSAWRGRTDRYSEERAEALESGRYVPADKVEMFRIGG